MPPPLLGLADTVCGCPYISKRRFLDQTIGLTLNVTIAPLDGSRGEGTQRSRSLCPESMLNVFSPLHQHAVDRCSLLFQPLTEQPFYSISFAWDPKVEHRMHSIPNTMFLIKQSAYIASHDVSFICDTKRRRSNRPNHSIVWRRTCSMLAPASC